VGVIKEEMRMLESVIIAAADKCSVPAGGALAVDRHEFAGYVTEQVKNHPNITVINEEIKEIPEGITVIATGPLTSEALSNQLRHITGEDYLYFL
jgi:methylenetetrahydrofolate--tRNA-(uracil-5-)-methyltransferase